MDIINLLTYCKLNTDAMEQRAGKEKEKCGIMRLYALLKPCLD